MADDFHAFRDFTGQSFEKAAARELNHIRRLGASENLTFVCSNLGAYEALLLIILNGDRGTPVYKAVNGVNSQFCGPAGILNRLKAFRSLGLLDEKEGVKKSEVCLVPSRQLLQEIYPVLSARHNDGLQR